MDNIRLFAKNEKELETLIQPVRICSWDIGMTFDIGKCTMLIMINSKRHITEGIELPNEEMIRMLGEKESYKYLGILEAETIKQIERKEQIRKSISGKRGNYSKLNYIAENSSKG